jgi:multidrug efflux pump subunit AcrA (membrane-fusion protein)
MVARKDEMRLSFKVGGIIKTLYVDEGQAVHRGQKLAEIELTEIDAQVAQARALADKAKRDLTRGERLYADEVISLEQLQDLRTQAETQRALLSSAEFNRTYAVITAPANGVVLRKLAQERELVPAGQPVLSVGAQDRGFIVRAALSDRELVQLRLGDPAQVRLDAYPGQDIPGTLTEIASAADEKSGLFPVEIRLDLGPAARPTASAARPTASADKASIPLASGLVAKIRLIPAAARANSLTYVPVGAILEGDGDHASVFVVEGNKARHREVRIAFVQPSGAALAAGLQPGEHVVTDGALYLQDQDEIEIVQDPAQVAGEAAGAGAG